MQPFAVLLMARGAEGWVNSVHVIFQYTYWHQIQKAWNDYIRKEELASVRKAIRAQSGKSGNKRKNKAPVLTREDIQRIKSSRRKEIGLSDIEPPKAEPFEFYIIPDSTEAAVEPIAVGYYDPTTEDMEVASWNDVSKLIL